MRDEIYINVKLNWIYVIHFNILNCSNNLLLTYLAPSFLVPKVWVCNVPIPLSLSLFLSRSHTQSLSHALNTLTHTLPLCTCLFCARSEGIIKRKMGFVHLTPYIDQCNVEIFPLLVWKHNNCYLQSIRIDVVILVVNIL